MVIGLDRVYNFFFLFPLFVPVFYGEKVIYLFNELSRFFGRDCCGIENFWEIVWFLGSILGTVSSCLRPIQIVKICRVRRIRT